MLKTDFQKYIHQSRYARWRDDLGRRETWEETVARYFDFFDKHLSENFPEALDKYRAARAELEQGVLNLDVVPSMRCLMTAGPALERDNVAGFNCSYAAVDHPRVFSEIMYILLCGTGVGFSVERQYINDLPIVPEELHSSDTCIVVADSKIGWASAYRELISLLYSGKVPKWDTAKIRPAGSRLKTFGGRASGPEPLEDLFRFTVEVFRGAVGRKLNSIEVHDIVCKIGDVVVVGGVRRSALISLSNLTDERMRHAKSGQWWEQNPQRALANNSVAYTEKPDAEIFLKEWLSLIQSKSGERGIFNRVASKKVAAKSGRRDTEWDFGTNPCCVPGYVQILTDSGYRKICDTTNGPVKVWNGEQWSEVSPFRLPGVHPIYRVTLSDGRSLDCTANHKFILADGSRCTTDGLMVGDALKDFEIPDPTFGPAKKGASVVSVQFLGQTTVYCFTEPLLNQGTFDGIVTGQSEIVLRSKQFCNLSEAVVRAKDTLEDLERKVRLATILGTLQSTLTNFRFLSKEWKNNTEEERLLGVSLTGIMDQFQMSKPEVHSPFLLGKLKSIAVETNALWAEALGIPQSTAITCVKPSGTVSQLVDAASGIHPRYAPYYIRTVRADKKDPLAQFMIDKGFPYEPDVTKPDNTLVFSFPQKAPEGAITRNDLTAIEQLELWKVYQDCWCEHKPSITVYVGEDEWLEVGAWVFKHFDDISGVSFLPREKHSYRQAPYQEITKEQYEEALSKMPSEIDWAEVAKYEREDNTTGSQEYACQSGACDII